MTTCVGLDLSLTGTGIARASWPLHKPRELDTWLLGTKAPPTAVAGQIAVRADRLVGLAGQIVERVAACEPDLVCIERPAYSSNTGSVTDRAGLFWLVCARLHRALGVPVVDVVNNHLKMYATGKGGGKGADKDAVLAETVRRYQELSPVLNNNNEADALVLAALGLDRLIGCPLVTLPETHRKAITAVKWPPTVPQALNRKDGC